jgi:DNA-binding PucR family transcriptional regulator
MASKTGDRTTVGALAETLREHVDPVALRSVERIARERPEWLTEYPEVAKRAYRFMRGSLDAMLAALAAGGSMPETCAAADLEFAETSARLEVPLRMVLDIYHRGFTDQWDAWFDVVEATDPDPDEQRRLIREGLQFFLAYGTWMMDQASQAYDRERAALVRTGEQRRVHLVRQVLAGKAVDLSPVGYELDAQHLGVVLWGERAHEAAEALAEAVDRRLLFVGVVEPTSWAWLGGRRALGGAQRRRLADFTPPPGTRVAIGVDAGGREGFRASHADAVEAHRAAWSTTRPVTFFDEISLEALAARDERAARRFVSRELRGIDSEDARSQRLRHTLTAYFAHAGNAAATAKALRIHEQTVAQRLTAVEERTGRSVLARRAELEAALRLRRYFTARPPRDGDDGANSGE